ncbi:MAG: hypothetical protein ABSF88_10430 [Candidatus Aminicenantales bacterium]
MKPNKPIYRIILRENKELDIQGDDKISWKTRGGEKKLSLACYLDDISERHDMLNATESYIQKKGFLFFRAVELYVNVREVSRQTKKLFNSSTYKNSINNISQEDFIQIREQLIDLHEKIDLSISKLLSIEKVRMFHRIFSRSRRSLEKEKEFIEEKIFDFQFGLNLEFPKAIEKMIGGIENSKIDESKVGRIGSII